MEESFKTLLLAGGKTKLAMSRLTGEEYKAFIRLSNPTKNPIVLNVYHALSQSKYISEIFVAGPDRLQEYLQIKKTFLLPFGQTMMETLLLNIQEFLTEHYILISSVDIPLLSYHHIDRFIKNCLNEPGYDIYYPIIEKEAYQRRFPSNDLRRIYAHLFEGSFTGGNIFFIQPRVIFDCFNTIQQFILFRKHPLKIAEMLGKRNVIKYLKKALSIRDIEKLVPEYLNGSTGKAILAEPEIALDIDKPVHLKALDSLSSHRV